MISRSELPEDAAEWASITVDLPRQEPDLPDSCPVPMIEIIDYIKAESADAGDVDEGRLSFIRTALVNQDRYWIWSYKERDGAECFIVARLKQDGSIGLCLSSPNGLNPEQYMLADYYDEIYWA